ncbi:MAG: GNAT family N-acetyltransferase [Cyclobacteriaceae bacterium]|nr:GNAT family N-acetyltransferase [Cyclobacteriaceae bacterium]
MITVRSAVLDDAISIIEFQLKMALETEGMHLDFQTVKKGVHAVFKDATKGAYYVAVDDDNVVGSLMTTYEWSDWRCGTVIWIQSVYIIPSHRGQGVYKNMYEHIQSLVTPESSYRGIRLYVDKTNHPAQRVYEKLGMNGEHYQVFEWMLST